MWTCFNHPRTARREDALAPESKGLLADSLGLVLLAFVLHDMFAVPSRRLFQSWHTSTAARQLANRGLPLGSGARHNVRHGTRLQLQVD